MNTSIKEYLNFGKVLFVQNGSLTIGFTLDIGPRVIYLAGDDGDNMFFTDTERHTVKDGNAMEEFFGKDKKWCLFGGHRIWLSPEKFPDTYHPDDTPIDYIIDGNRIKISGQAVQSTGLKMEIEVEFISENELNVINRIYNSSDKEITGAVWALSVMDGQGMAAVKQSDIDTDLLHNRVMSIWPYTDIHDGRLYIGNKFVSVRQSAHCKKPIKIAINDVHGRAVYFKNGKMFEKRYPVDFSKQYPDNGVNCEIYTNYDFLELESLSPIQSITPGAYIEHKEVWKLHGNVPTPAQDDNELESVFSNY